MIHFNLCCEHGHQFDGWFRSNEDYEKQQRSGLISCPICSSVKIGKALMTPALTHKTKQAPLSAPASSLPERKFWQRWQALARHVRDHGDYVGKNFATEARKIHLGEADERAIYGEAKSKEIVSLLEDGIEIIPLPPLPEEQN